MWLKQLSVGHKKHHVKFTNERVLTMIVEVQKCGESRMVRHSWSFCLTAFSDFDRYKFYVCEAHFRAELIGASPAIIACNSKKLFAFLLGFST